MLKTISIFCLTAREKYVQSTRAISWTEKSTTSYSRRSRGLKKSVRVSDCCHYLALTHMFQLVKLAMRTYLKLIVSRQGLTSMEYISISLDRTFRSATIELEIRCMLNENHIP